MANSRSCFVPRFVRRTKLPGSGVYQSMMLRYVALRTGLVTLLASAHVFLRPACAQEIPARLLQRDFQIMRHALEEAHGGLYRYTKKSDMDQTFDQAYKRIDHAMTGLEFWALVAPVVAHIRDGHLFTYWPTNIPIDRLPLFPLSVRVLNKRVFVYRDFSSDDRRLEGAELLSINDVPMKRILQKMSTALTGEGRSKSAVPYRIGNYDWFKDELYGLLKIESPFRVAFRNSEGKQTREIAGKTLPELDAAWTARDPKPEMKAHLKFQDDGKIAVLTIRSFDEYVDSRRTLKIHDFLQQSFEQIREKQSESLIIDVRDNGGGLDAPGAQLFSYLWDKPFEYYKDKVINAREFDFYKFAPDAKRIPAHRVEKGTDGKFHYHGDPGLGLQQPRQPHFGGKVFALMNGGSFSTTCEFLSMLPLHTRGVLIGEEAAGDYFGCTCGFRVNLTLPNSRVHLPLGMVTYYYAAADYKHANRGMIPDYPVAHTIEDLLAGRDKDMDLALALARSKQGRP
jgi:hypothetical protein